MAETFKAFENSPISDINEEGRYFGKDRVCSYSFNKKAPYDMEVTFNEDIVWYFEHQNWIRLPLGEDTKEYFFSQYYTRLPNGNFRPIEGYDLPQVIKDFIIRDLTEPKDK